MPAWWRAHDREGKRSQGRTLLVSADVITSPHVSLENPHWWPGTDLDPAQGELVINSIDRDGQMKGYDLALAQKVRQLVNIPITILGGAGALTDLESLIRTCGVIGASAGSLFVFKGVYKAVLINYPTLAQRDDLVKSALG